MILGEAEGSLLVERCRTTRRPVFVQSMDRVGSALDGWQIESLVTSSPVAETYNAFRSGERASIKVLHRTFAASSAAREVFLGQADESRRIDHPCVPRVTCAVTSPDDDVYLVMAPVEGETLDSMWKRSPSLRMPALRALPILARVLSCLVVAHGEGVLHRCLHPSKVVLGQGDVIEVLGFHDAAVSDAAPELRNPEACFGAPRYMATEQAMGVVEQLDGRADLFSVGAMMHALLTGHEIHEPGSDGGALEGAAMPVPPVSIIAPDLSPKVARVVDRALQWDRRRRYANASEMHDAVMEALLL